MNNPLNTLYCKSNAFVEIIILGSFLKIESYNNYNTAFRALLSLLYGKEKSANYSKFTGYASFSSSIYIIYSRIQ